MPLFYHGFVPAGIGLMMMTLAAKQVYLYWKKRHSG